MPRLEPQVQWELAQLRPVQESICFGLPTPWRFAFSRQEAALRRPPRPLVPDRGRGRQSHAAAVAPGAGAPPEALSSAQGGKGDRGPVVVGRSLLEWDSAL